MDSRNVSPQLYGFLEVLSDGKHLQKAKELDLGSGESATIIARAAILRMEKDWVYIIGPGGTTWKIKELLCENDEQEDTGKKKVHGTVRGVDVIRNGKIILRDANERELWNCVNSYSHIKILVTCIGGNGFLLGRGNQQISPRVIRKVGKEQIEIVATKEKLAGLGGQPMHVDTGDADADERHDDGGERHLFVLGHVEDGRGRRHDEAAGRQAHEEHEARDVEAPRRGVAHAGDAQAVDQLVDPGGDAGHGQRCEHARGRFERCRGFHGSHLLLS